jgi:MFS family permease
MQRRFGGLWRNADFLKLWTGETISLFGTQITTLALPLTAVLVLSATPVQIGILNAASFAPFLLFSLPAGVFVDRKRRRPILIISNLGRGLLLGLIPLLALLGVLRIEHLIPIAFLVGVLTVFFHLAYHSFLPTLVARDQLVEGNSKLTASESIAEIGGPGLAGLLIQLGSAPFAIFLDAISYLISALSLSLIRAAEPEPERPASRSSMLQEIGEGLRVVFGNRYLRAIAGEAATYNLFWSVIEAVLLIYATRNLALSAGAIGLIFTVGSIGGLLGAFIAEPAARRFGVGLTILTAMAISCVVMLLIPFAPGPGLGSAVLLALVMFITGLGAIVSNVNVISLRQTVTPERLLGRMNASYRFLNYGAIPIGALLGGFLGERIGLQMTLLVGALGISTAWLWVLFSPVRSMRTLPAPAEAAVVPPVDGAASASVSPTP